MRRSRTTKRRLASVVIAVLLPVGVHSGVAASAPATGGDPRDAVAAPRLPGPTPLTTGNGVGAVARTPGGPITEAFGRFEAVLGVARVKSRLEPGAPPTDNAYTIQLNTDPFKVEQCAGSPAPALCEGWKQYVFANNGTSGEIFVEYWLRNYNDDGRCPSAEWDEFYAAEEFAWHCRSRGPVGTFPNVPITNMANPNLKLTATFAEGQDKITFNSGDGENTVSTPTRLQASPGDPGWTMAEFNVFGFDYGSEAEFTTAPGGPAVDFHARTWINHGGPQRPICESIGFSAETNNLSFVIPKPLETQPGPAVISHQRLTGQPTSAGCEAAVTVGDTHQLTFAGLLYDFQATGDFVEAQVGTAFEVQTRKISGAPSWPKASLNRSVATRMGSTRVAVCEGTSLVVNGVPTQLAPGGSLLLQTGVEIHRVGNEYIVKDRSGNSIRVAANTSANPHYTDLEVNVGTWPTAVRGLMGNPGNNPEMLEARNGRPYLVDQMTHTQLYGEFGTSWRVSPIASLLQPCASVAAGNPSGPFFAGHLPYYIYYPAEGVCRSYGVTAAWLDACILDVAVLGQRAAAVFVRREPPVHNGNPALPPPCQPTHCFGLQPR